MDYTNLISKVRQDIEELNKPTVITEGYSFDYNAVLKKIQFYLASKFLKGLWDKDAFKKLFINIIKFRVKASSKSVNIDLKDLKVTSEEGAYKYPAYFLKCELRPFMKKNGFSEFFNEVAQKAPRFGSVIVKDVKGKPVLVALKNFRWDQTCNKLESSSAVLEYHPYTVAEFKNAAIENDWDTKKVKEVIALYSKHKASIIQVVEWYGFTEAKDLTESPTDPEAFVRGRAIMAGLELVENEADPVKRAFTGEPVTIDTEVIEELPYMKFDWDEEEGRGLGVGVVEDLFIEQEYYNDTVHLERKSMHWSSKKLFKSKDENAPANLFSKVTNGDVLNVRDLEPVVIEERNQAQYNIVLQRITGNANDNAASYEVQTGKSLPSGTPFRQSAQLLGAVNSLFESQRERLSLFYVQILKKFVIPKFKAEKLKAHSFRFEGDPGEMEEVREMLVGAFLNKEVRDFQEKNGRLPSLEEYQNALTKFQNQNGLYIELPEGFYKDIIDNIDNTVTIEFVPESVDYASELETLGNIFSIIAKNPAVLEDPRLKNMLYRITERAGISPYSIFPTGTKNPQASIMGAMKALTGGGAEQVPQPTEGA